MKLGNVRSGDVFLVDGLQSAVLRPGDYYRIGARFRCPVGGRERLAFHLFNRGWSSRALGFVTGTVHSANVWGLSGGTAIANVGRWVFASQDDGSSWEFVLELPETSPPKGLLPSSVCEHEGRIYLCTYPMAGAPAQIYRSDDGGRSWNVFVERDDVRHFHGLYPDPHADRLWANTGDRDGESAIGTIAGDEFVPIGRGGQQWRGVELAMTPRYVLWGKDATYAAEREIYRLDRDDLDDPDPEPEVVGGTDSILFYLRCETFGSEPWVIGSTSPQTGIDSTASPDDRRNTCGNVAKIVAAPASSGYETWYEIYSVERRRVLGDLTGLVPTADAHVFIDTDPGLGVVANPWNTASNDGDLLRIPPEVFDVAHLESRSDDRAGTSAVGRVTIPS